MKKEEIEKRKRTYGLTILSGTLLILLSVFFQMQADYDPVINMTVANAGTIIVVLGVLRYNRHGAGVVKDERTIKVATKAASYSWFMTFVLISIIYWVDYLNPGLLTIPAVLGILMAFMSVTMYFYKWYLNKKGGV